MTSKPPSDPPTPTPSAGSGGTALPGPELVVFSDDWGRHPSSCQHLVRQLLPRYRVHWINTIGTRTPGLDRSTVRRGLGKLGRWLAPERSARPEGIDPRVHEPLMWPRFRRRWERRLNAWLLSRYIRRILSPEREAVAITTLPLVADLVGSCPVRRWIYYCVDDLGAWPGLDGPTLREMERQLAGRVDTVIAASEELAGRMESFGRKAHLLTHGVDLDHWRRPPDGIHTALDAAAPPRIVFWGVVDRRLDPDWLEMLSLRLENGSIVLVGPIDEAEARLSAIRRLSLLRAVPYADLPGLVRRTSVLIMPYRDMAATRAMQPLKLKEYLATDLPVVVRDLPAVEPWRDACDVAATATEFAHIVVERLATGLPPAQARARRRLDLETWRHKAEHFEELVLDRAGVPRRSR